MLKIKCNRYNHSSRSEILSVQNVYWKIRLENLSTTFVNTHHPSLSVLYVHVGRLRIKSHNFHVRSSCYLLLHILLLYFKLDIIYFGRQVTTDTSEEQCRQLLTYPLPSTPIYCNCILAFECKYKITGGKIKNHHTYTVIAITFNCISSASGQMKGQLVN